MSLAGKRVVNTRAAHQAAELDQLLAAHGAIPVSYPCIAITPPEDTTALDDALTRRDFDLLVLTSTNTVRTLQNRLQALGVSLAGTAAAAVGEVTARAAQDTLGAAILCIPDEYSADDLVHALGVSRGMRILLPQSEIARPALADSLRARGATVIAVTAYQTVRGSGGADLVPMLRDRKIDAVTFTSSSTARYFVERLGEAGGAPLDGVMLASIGAQTSKTLHELGLNAAVEAQPHTLEGLINTLALHFQEQPS